MTPDEARLRCLELVFSKAPQNPDVNVLIERASVLYAFVAPDTPRGPGRPKGSTNPIKADTV